MSLYRVQLELQSSRRQLARKEAELSFALEVQQALFPRHLPESNGLEFAAVCIPARGISGDYYDVVQFPDGRLVFAIADISGKGISAAILMANVQALLRTLSETGNPPAEVCKTAESSSSSGYRCLEVRNVFLCGVERGRTPDELCQRRTLCAGVAWLVMRPPVVGRRISARNVSDCRVTTGELIARGWGLAGAVFGRHHRSGIEDRRRVWRRAFCKPRLKSAGTRRWRRFKPEFSKRCAVGQGTSLKTI